VPHVEGDAIAVSASFRARAHITVEPVKRELITPEIRVTGTVTYDPAYVAAVGTRIRGLVRRLTKIEGQLVDKGDPLAEIESADLGEAQASIAMAKAQLNAAQLHAARQKELSGHGLTSMRDLELADAELAERRALLASATQKASALGGEAPGALGVYTLRAPMAGTIVDRGVASGQTVEGQTVAFRIADLDHLWIELEVFEQSLGAVQKGDPVDVKALAEGAPPMHGVVAYVGHEVDRATRSAPVRVEIDNRARSLRPGQAVTAVLHPKDAARTDLVIPKRAVTQIDGKHTVFVALAEDRFAPRAVTLGPSDGKRDVVLAGLEDGARVVVDGVFALKSELYR
jgi:cobalt-zinc-cadmium efflux system membrane fusion protein